MILFIQVPCLNEENSLANVLNSIPKSIEGVSSIQTVIIDDGSTDRTIEVAQNYGVSHIIKNIGNKGLGNSFRIGMNFAFENGADILVNTDGDNQYPSKFISELIDPIIKKEADIVIGDRQTKNIKHFSPIKRFFQWLGTRVTIALSGEKMVADAVSGFRAYSRHAMLEINVTSQFSYVLDTTLQASQKKLKTISIPIQTNAPTRPSRLFTNMRQHIRKSAIDILRVYAMYKPLRIFIALGLFFLITGIIPIFRFLYDYLFFRDGSGKIQSLIIGCTLISISFNFFALGIIGDLMSRNRNLIEQALNRLKSLE